MATKDTRSTFEVVAEERLLEADRLKKAWFDHVFASLEKLGESVDKLSFDLHCAKESLYKDIVIARESLRKELTGAKTETTLDLEKLERRIEKTIDNINKNIESISVHAVKEELKRDIESLRKETEKGLTKIKENRVTPLSDDIIRLKVKVAVWSILGGILGSAILGGILRWLIPMLFKSLVSP